MNAWGKAAETLNNSSYTIPSDLGSQKSLPHTQNLVPKAIKTELRTPPVTMKLCQGLVPHPLLCNSILTADWLLSWSLPAMLNVIGCLRAGLASTDRRLAVWMLRWRLRSADWSSAGKACACVHTHRFLCVCAHARIGVLGWHETHVLPLEISHLRTTSPLGIIIKTLLHVQCCFDQS